MKKQKNSKRFETSSFIVCPNCNEKKMKVVQRVDNIPYFDEVLETFASCDGCDFKSNDIIFLSDKKASITHEIVVKKEKDLHVRVVKSKSAKIEIPEIELTVTPGPGSEAFITNVEGLLLRIKDKVKGFSKIHPEKIKEIEKTLAKLDDFIKAKEEFTIIISDELGRSFIELKSNL